jgi:hypothetical protein
MKIDIEISKLTIDKSKAHITEFTEFEILKQNIYKIMNNDMINFDETAIRYVRYLQEIENWLSYDYLKNDIIEFLNEHDNDKKYKIMVSIDMTLFKLFR